jgi:Silicon transporter
MEGIQISLFAVVHLTSEELKNDKIVAANCEIDLGAFLICRQICVTCCMFVVARITTLDVDTAAGDPTIVGVSSGAQVFFNTGIIGVITTTIVGSLAWRIAALSFPVAFLFNPLIYWNLRLNLLLIKSGLCASAWLLSLIHSTIVGYQLGELYIGAKEEGACLHSTSSFC